MARTALIIDDDKAIIALLAAILSSRGFTPTQCSDPSKALEMVRSMKPDLVLLDVVMPGIDGIALCRDITNSDLTPKPVVVVISGIAKSVTFRSEAMRAGALDLIPKPVTLHAIDSILSRAFPPETGSLRPVERPASKPRPAVTDEGQARNLSGGEMRYTIGPRKPPGQK